MKKNTPIIVKSLAANDFNNYLNELTEILYQCVHDGASVGFILPFSKDESRNYWLNKVLPSLLNSKRIVLIAKLDGHIAGTVQLDCDTPPNQSQRAEVSKLLVAPKFQKRGVAKKLMFELEERGLKIGRSLLTLDTRTGDKAEPLYLALGYEKSGVIPNFARDPIIERYDGTTLMFKKLRT